MRFLLRQAANDRGLLGSRGEVVSAGEHSPASVGEGDEALDGQDERATKTNGESNDR